MKPLKNSLENFIQEHLKSLYNTARRLTRNATEAEDLVQETFLMAWQYLKKDKGIKNLKPWMFKILLNLYRDKYRKARREPSPEEVKDFYLFSHINSDDPAKELARLFLREDVEKALEELPDKYRTAVILADLQDFSYKEIAAITSCSAGTVMSRLYRGRRLLQQKLWRYARGKRPRVHELKEPPCLGCSNPSPKPKVFSKKAVSKS
jgi:RNA polymerase sigma-70 factor (ECF subfamily)